MTRLFVALNIPDPVKQEIIRLRNQAFPGYHNYKWEPVEKIHLTLKFIGELEEKFIDPLINELEFIADYRKLSCSLTRFGFFFKNKDPKILWIGLSLDSSIMNLVKELNDRLSRFEIEPEKRDFKAHITLLRIKTSVDKNFIKKYENFIIPETRFTADELILYKSELMSAGSKYTELKNFILK